MIKTGERTFYPGYHCYQRYKYETYTRKHMIENTFNRDISMSTGIYEFLNEFVQYYHGKISTNYIYQSIQKYMTT